VNEGIPISQWAMSHGFKPQEVYAFVSGKTTGVRGRAHQIAVALGVRPPPTGSTRPNQTIHGPIESGGYDSSDDTEDTKEKR